MGLSTPAFSEQHLAGLVFIQLFFTSLQGARRAFDPHKPLLTCLPAVELLCDPASLAKAAGSNTGTETETEQSNGLTSDPMD